MIRIKNIYYMLSYAFQVLNEQGYKQILTEEFDDATELCAAILIKGAASQLKRGLKKEYVLRTEPLSTVRGKIDIFSSMKHQTKKQLVCNYDDFSVDSYLNRIIRTTMDFLIRSDLSKERKKKLRKLLVFFGEVKPVNPKNINWNIQYNRNNQTYQMLISICHLILNGLILTSTDGQSKMMTFLDEQRMYKLYEKFILEYYKKEYPQIKTSASQISWDLDYGESDMLPIMQSDIMLQYQEKTLIIDAKYYSRTMQERYGVHTLHSQNLYQIYTYVKNFDTEKSGNVEGMLLYAKTDERILPNNTYKMGGNFISVKSLDLNCDFIKIKEQLNKIADDTFPKLN